MLISEQKEQEIPLSLRSGPHPLSVHLGMAASKAFCMQSNAKNSDLNISESNLIEMMRGIQIYQKSQHVVQRPAIKIIDDINGAKLYTLKQQHNELLNTAPLLIIPSLINRSYIFNLNTKRSILRFLSEHGVPTYILDWGDLEGEQLSTLDGIVRTVLPRAIEHVAQKFPQQGRVDLLGYCMGGLLALGAAKEKEDLVSRIVLLASPWDFKHKKNELARAVRIGSSGAFEAMINKETLSMQWIQALFASLDPDIAINKFIKFSKMAQDNDDAHMFIDVEDWLNDNVDIPRSIAENCLQKWFLDNVFVDNSWFLGDVHMDLKSMRTNMLVVASSNDRLIPYDSAIGVKDFFENAQVDILQPTCGHIGFIAGRNALQETWLPIVNWLKKS